MMYRGMTSNETSDPTIYILWIMSALSDQIFIFYSFEDVYKFLNSLNFISPFATRYILDSDSESNNEYDVLRKHRV